MLTTTQHHRIYLTIHRTLSSSYFMFRFQFMLLICSQNNCPSTAISRDIRTNDLTIFFAFIFHRTPHPIPCKMRKKDPYKVYVFGTNSTEPHTKDIRAENLLQNQLKFINSRYVIFFFFVSSKLLVSESHLSIEKYDNAKSRVDNYIAATAALC